MKKGINNMSKIIGTLLGFLFVTPIVPIIIVVFKVGFNKEVYIFLGIYTLVTLGIYIPFIREEADTFVKKLGALMLSMIFAAPITSIVFFSIRNFDRVLVALLYLAVSTSVIMGVILIIDALLKHLRRK